MNLFSRSRALALGVRTLGFGFARHLGMHYRESGFLPGGDAADFDLAVVSRFLQDGRRTGSPASAPSINDHRLALGNFVEARLQFVDRDVVVAVDGTLFFQFLRRADIEKVDVLTRIKAAF